MRFGLYRCRACRSQVGLKISESNRAAKLALLKGFLGLGKSGLIGFRGAGGGGGGSKHIEKNVCICVRSMDNHNTDACKYKILCMHVCMGMNMNMNMNTSFVYIHLYTYTCVCLRIHADVSICAYMHEYIHPCIQMVTPMLVHKSTNWKCIRKRAWQSRRRALSTR